VRGLDTIPFRSSLKVDMEVWHWTRAVLLDYSVTTYWYGDAGAYPASKLDAKLLAAPDGK
jgi:hypothetical protein